MTLLKSDSVLMVPGSLGGDFSLRRFFARPPSSGGQPLPLQVLFDPDSAEISVTVPYNEVEVMGRGVISRDRAEDTVYMVFHSGSDSYAYYVAGSRSSGTAPDRFWTFELARDPFFGFDLSDVRGIWNATQRPNDSGLTFAVESDAMKPSRSAELPRMHAIDGADFDNFIVKISATERVTVDSSGHVTRAQDSPTTYYTFTRGWYDGYVVVSPSGVGYVTIDEIIEDVDSISTTSAGETFGITPSSITDISISCRSPFIMDGRFIRGMDYTVIGKSKKHRNKTDAIYIVNGFNYSEGPSETVTVNLTDLEYRVGSVSLFTENDDRMASVPVQNLKDATVKCFSVSDVTGLYTEIDIDDTHMMIPEGKLPYVGSAWSEYAIAQQSFDRENMTLAIQNAKSEAVQNSMMGIANGVLTGGLIGGPLGAVGGVASAGLNVAGTALELQRNERTARAQQGLQEKMISNSVGTAFNTGYGLEYLRKASSHRGRFQIYTPQHLTQSRYDAYVREHGYPDSSIEHTLDLRRLGYVQGYVTDPSIPKHRRDEMNRQLTEGVRFI